MAKINHEKTNRRVLSTKEYLKDDWRMINCTYPRKCDICKNWIDDNTKVLWNTKTKHIMHIDCI